VKEGGANVLALERRGGNLGGHEEAGEGEDEGLECETHSVLFWRVFGFEID
jgi:hypothetical protein